MKKYLILVFLSSITALAAAQNHVARTVKYAAKDIVPIKAKVRYTTLVVLPPGEKILDFVTGDKDFWMVEGVENFCYIKPAKESSSTNVTLITASGNVYSLILSEVSDAGGEPDLKVFIEPSEQTLVQAMNATPKFVAASEIDKAKAVAVQATAQAEKEKDDFRVKYPVHFIQMDYSYEKNKKPFLVSSIYHDDKFTFIRTGSAELPAIYELRDGKPNLVNFEVKDGAYVIPKIVDKGYLVIGEHKMGFERQQH